MKPRGPRSDKPETASGTPRWVVARNSFLVTYDISNDLRLSEVHKAMRGFGDHLQYSVFECQFTPTDLVPSRHVLSTLVPEQVGSWRDVASEDR